MAAVTLVAVALAVAVWLAARRTPARPPPGGRPRRLFRPPSARFVVVWLLVAPAWLLAVAAALRGSLDVATVVVVVLGPVVCAPWILARLVAIPVGAPRLAATLAALAERTWGVDRDGGVALAAVLAARRSGRPEDLASARAYVERIDLVGGAGVVAAALLDDHDGDVASSGRLLDALPYFDPRVVPPVALRVAVELRAQHLLASGDWTALAELAPAGSRFVFFASGCAARIAGVGEVDARSDWMLWLQWLLAPRRRRTRALLRRALARPLTPTPRAPAPRPPALPEAPLPRAVGLHLWTTRTQRACTPDAVVALAQAWDCALGVERDRQDERRRAHEGPGDGLEDTVVDALAELLATLDLSRFALADQPDVLARAIERQRTARLDALEVAVAALRARLEQAAGSGGGDLAPVLELREWLALRALYDDVARLGADGRSLAWQSAQTTVCELGVRLWNVRAEHRLANAIHRWLHVESVLVGDERATEVHDFNVRCGP